MTFVPRLSHSDMDGALALVAEAAGTNGAQPFEEPTIERLMDLIAADRAGFYEAVSGGDGNLYSVGRPVDVELDWGSDVIAATVWTWPLWERRMDSLPEVPLKLSDFLTRAQLRRNPWHVEVHRPCGVEHEFKVWLPAPEGVLRGFFFLRGPDFRDFDERDRALLTLLRPHLTSIRERWERRRRPAVLTARETEVLELVAQGLTNGQIARRLVIAPTTVRTHLENIFEKLGVHTRTAAVASIYSVDRAS